MFSLKEYYEILNKDPIKAKEYCLKYEDDICASCELILLKISYFNDGDLNDNFSELEKLINKLNNSEYKDRIKAILANLAYELKNYKKSLKYSSKLIEKNSDDNILSLYYLSKINSDNDQERSVEELEKLLFSSNKLAPFFINENLYSIGNYYYQNEDYDSAEAYFNKCYLVLEDKEIVARLHMLLLTYYDTNKEKLKETFKTWKRFSKEDKHYLFFSDLIQNYDLANNEPELAKEIYDEFENCDIFKDLNDQYINKGMIDFSLNNYRDSYNEFKKINKEILYSNYPALYTFGLSILYIDDRRLFKEGIEALELLKDSNSTYAEYANRCLKYLYLAVHNFEKVEEIMETDRSEFDYDLKALCLTNRGKFDEAHKLLKKYYKDTKKTSYRYPFSKVGDDEISKKIFEQYQKGNTSEDYRQKAIMHFHGFGVASESNPSLALEYALKAYQLEPNRNCHGSILGNIYLSMREYDKAYSLFKEGYESYINYKENCACSMGFYCYCLMFGCGCQKDEDEAYKILNEFNYDDASDLIVYAYAYLCLKRKENIQRAYELLLSVNEWRYDVGKYYLLIKVSKILGIDSREYENKYQENLKHAPIREREHYKNNPDIYYLTNI